MPSSTNRITGRVTDGYIESQRETLHPSGCMCITGAASGLPVDLEPW